TRIRHRAATAPRAAYRRIRRRGAAREGDEEVGWLKTLHRRRVDAPFRTHDQPGRKPGPKFASTPARNAWTTQVDVTPRQRLTKFSVAAPEPARLRVESEKAIKNMVYREKCLRLTPCKGHPFQASGAGL